MAKIMVSPTLCLLALLISLQTLANADGKALSNAGNEDAEVQESPAPPTDERNGAAPNTIRGNEKEEGFAPFYSRKLREGFRLLKGGKSGGKSLSRVGSSSTSSPAPSPNGSETKYEAMKWYEWLAAIAMAILLLPILYVVALFKMAETQAQMAMFQNFFGK
ncbi:hypothetical protein RHSIM_Rhsim07G0190200 [Rhododendron simsii]|uniref:Transmembrane protein n=1 Tax=Rhododendron simsii TaxID=118357 RepID=A0A834LJP0_RHOSS|nr:hypothetical protein RHSIM_Rhsim07G0190200 [Rhododendron simsii]